MRDKEVGGQGSGVGSAGFAEGGVRGRESREGGCGVGLAVVPNGVAERCRTVARAGPFTYEFCVGHQAIYDL